MCVTRNEPAEAGRSSAWLWRPGRRRSADQREADAVAAAAE